MPLTMATGRASGGRFNRQSMRRVIIKQGYLKKLPNAAKVGAFFKKPERRWFIFGVLSHSDPYLEYFESEEGIFTSSPRNLIPLETCRYIIRDHKHKRYVNVFTLVMKDRHLSLVAQSRQVMMEWCRSLETKLLELGIMESGENPYVDLPGRRTALVRSHSTPTGSIRDPVAVLQQPPLASHRTNQPSRTSCAAAIASSGASHPSTSASSGSTHPNGSCAGGAAAESCAGAGASDTCAGAVGGASDASGGAVGGTKAGSDTKVVLRSHASSPGGSHSHSPKTPPVRSRTTRDSRPLPPIRHGSRKLPRLPSEPEARSKPGQKIIENDGIQKSPKRPPPEPPRNNVCSEIIASHTLLDSTASESASEPSAKPALKSRRRRPASVSTVQPVEGVRELLPNGYSSRTTPRTDPNIPSPESTRVTAPQVSPAGSTSALTPNGLSLQSTPVTASDSSSPGMTSATDSNVSSRVCTPETPTSFILPSKMCEALGMDTSDDNIGGWNRPPPDRGAPPLYMPKGVLERGANRSLRQSQVVELSQEMANTNGISVVLRKIDCYYTLGLVEGFGALWIGGWNQHARPFLYRAFHIGDQLISINGHVVNTCKAAHKLVKNCSDEDQITFVIRRLPHARAIVITRNYEGENLGITRNGGTAEITSIVPSGLADQQGVPAKALKLTGDGLCNWCLTEINHRPLNLFFKDNEIDHRLNAIGMEISILLQPIDLIDEFKKQLKAVYKNYKDLLVQ